MDLVLIDWLDWLDWIDWIDWLDGLDWIGLDGWIVWLIDWLIDWFGFWELFSWERQAVQFFFRLLVTRAAKQSRDLALPRHEHHRSPEQRLRHRHRALHAAPHPQHAAPDDGVFRVLRQLDCRVSAVDRNIDKTKQKTVGFERNAHLIATGPFLLEKKQFFLIGFYMLYISFTPFLSSFCTVYSFHLKIFMFCCLFVVSFSFFLLKPGEVFCRTPNFMGLFFCALLSRRTSHDARGRRFNTAICGL